MDGLLINSEDLITLSTNRLLEKYDRPKLTRSIRAQLMGVPNSTNGDPFHDWAKLPIPANDSPVSRLSRCGCIFGLRATAWCRAATFDLSRARSASSGEPIKLALASSTKSNSYEIKTSRPETKRLLSFFPPDRRVLGDDPRVREGRGKPAPDIYLVALQALNAAADPGEETIMPNECLVFEDSVVGVEAGRRAGMRVIWVPHPDVAIEYQAMKEDVLAGRSGMTDIGDHRQLGEVDDGWAESIDGLTLFNYEKYGIVVAVRGISVMVTAAMHTPIACRFW